jgi:hypothetical protein
LRIPYGVLDGRATVRQRIDKALTLATSAQRPVALLLDRDLMWEDGS